MPTVQSTFTFYPEIIANRHTNAIRAAAARFRGKTIGRTDPSHPARGILARDCVVDLDVETRSRCVIADTGIVRYTLHPSTDVLGLVYTINEEQEFLWIPGEPPPPVFGWDGVQLYTAHNATFERWIYNKILVPRYRFPPLPLEKWDCTAARAAHQNLPRGLARLCERLRLPFSDAKFKAGHDNMVKLCRPHQARKNKCFEVDGLYKGGVFDEDVDRHTINFFYCAQDVKAETAVKKNVLPLPPREREIWELDQVINARGVSVDVEMCKGATRILREGILHFHTRLCDITNGQITTHDQRERILKYARTHGVQLPDLQKETVQEFLDNRPLPDDVREILSIRQLLGSAAVCKYQAILNCVGDDARCRDQFLYYAAGTGRWGGKLAQFHNLKNSPAPPPEVIETITAGDYDRMFELCHGQPVQGLGCAVRSAVKAPDDRELVISDLSQIEARMLAWVAGDTKQLELFWAGKDVYRYMAGQVYNEDPESIPKKSPKRQLGKVMELGLGYGCGATKFQSVAWSTSYFPNPPWDKEPAGEGIRLTDEESANLVELYRAAHPPIVQFWWDLGDACMKCIRHGKTIRHKNLVLRREGEFFTIEMPSGRKLFYHRPYIIYEDGRPEIVYLDGKKGVTRTHGAKICENLVQALSRDVFAHCMLLMYRLGIFTTLHCHDENHSERRTGDDATKDLIQQCMTTCPRWADGLPLAAETKVSTRYDK